MTATRRWQVALIVIGVALLGVGGVVLLNDVSPARYLGIAAWFVGALVVHDGIAALVVFGASIALRRAGRRIPPSVIAIVQGALVVWALVAALVIPEILKRAIGTANPTILPLDYGMNLLLFSGALAVVAGVASGAVILARVVTRRRTRPR